MQRHALRPKEKLRCPQHKNILTAVERVAQDHVHELIEENRRCSSDSLAHQIEISSFQRLRAHEAISEANHHLPIFSRIRVGKRGDFRLFHRPPRIAKHCRMQRALCSAGFRRRREFRPRQIYLQKLICDQQPAAVVAIEQVVTAGEPEISHFRTSWPSLSKSTCSTGSSSPSTSKNAKARSGFGPPRGRRVRKA